MEKTFNRNILFYILYTLDFVFILFSVAAMIYVFSSDLWRVACLPLLCFGIGLIALFSLINKKDDVIIDETYKKVRSNIKFRKQESFCISFDSIVSVTVYSADRLKNEINLKRYPANTLVIEKKHGKEYIPLKFFDEKTILSLIKELQKVRESI